MTAEQVKEYCQVCSGPKTHKAGADQQPFFSSDPIIREQTRARDVEWADRRSRAIAELEGNDSPPVVSTPKNPSSSTFNVEKSAGRSETPRKSKPGVITRIIEVLRAASKKSPVTREEILKDLVRSFPDREERAMRSTVGSQVPSALKTEKGLIVQTDGNGGYWLPKE